MDICILIHRFINMKNLFVYNGLWKREGIKERLSFYILNTFDLLKNFFLMMNGVMFYNQPKQ